MLKLMIIGLGRHGKDTACEILEAERGYTFTSSSWHAADKVVYPLLKRKYGYSTVQECFDDRHNHRSDWYNIINNFNNPNLSRLAESIYDENDIYCGLRHKKEYDAIRDKKLFDYCIWIDAFERLGQTEDKSSISLTQEDADYVIYNNETLDQFKTELLSLIDTLEDPLYEKVPE